MKRHNFYDAVMFIFVFTVAYLLGVHTAMPKEEPKTTDATLTVLLGESDRSIKVGDACTLDRDTSLTVLSLSDDGSILTLSCKGKLLEAGFLSSGGKYLVANQPVSLAFDKEIRTGRIISVLLNKI